MEALWIPITILAAAFQTARTGLQKHLKGSLSTNGVTFARFIFGWPLAWAYLGTVIWITGEPLPALDLHFFAFSTLGAVCQIAGTALLVMVFSFRNFAVGTTYAKTEAVQTAIIGVILFGEALSPMAFVAIVISVVGVVMISIVRTGTEPIRLFTRLKDKAAWLGLGAGLGLGVGGLAAREASIGLGGEGFLVQAAATLVAIVTIQFVLLGGYLAVREPEQYSAIARQWKLTALTGITSVLGSACWFTAFSIQTVAYVLTLGKIELIFSLLVSYLVFKERSVLLEWGGMAMVAAGILLLMYYA